MHANVDLLYKKLYACECRTTALLMMYELFLNHKVKSQCKFNAQQYMQQKNIFTKTKNKMEAQIHVVSKM